MITYILVFQPHDDNHDVDPFIPTRSFVPDLDRISKELSLLVKGMTREEVDSLHAITFFGVGSQIKTARVFYYHKETNNVGFRVEDKLVGSIHNNLTGLPADDDFAESWEVTCTVTPKKNS